MDQCSSSPTHNRFTHPERRARRSEISTDVLGGDLPHEVAAKHGVSLAWVRACLLEFDVPWPDRRVTRGSTVSIVGALLSAGPKDTLRKIGARLNVSHQRVHQILEQCRRYNLIKEWPGEHKTRHEALEEAGRGVGKQAQRPVPDAPRPAETDHPEPLPKDREHAPDRMDPQADEVSQPDGAEGGTN